MKSVTIQRVQTSIRQNLYVFGNEKLTFSRLTANSVCHLLWNLLLFVKKFLLPFLPVASSKSLPISSQPLVPVP